MSKTKRRNTIDPLVTVVERNHFYHSCYHRLMIIVVISGMMNLVLGGSYIYLLLHPPAPIYFATTIDGRILPVYPLDTPNQADIGVLDWAKSAAMAAFTYNYTDFRQEFQASSDYFSPWGWTQFLQAIKESNNLEAVKKKKLVVSAELLKDKPSEIDKSGVNKGRYVWRVNVPLLVTYQSTMVYTQQRTMVTMMIVRQSNLNSPAGVGIDQFVVAPLNPR